MFKGRNSDEEFSPFNDIESDGAATLRVERALAAHLIKFLQLTPEQQTAYIADVRVSDSTVADHLEIASDSRRFGSPSPNDIHGDDVNSNLTLIDIKETIRIDRAIGSGGMGSVYLAKENDRPVALKILASHRRINTADMSRFRREQQALSRLKHPNIVEVQTVSDDGAYFTMEFVDGINLEQWRLEKRFPSGKEIAGLIQIVAEAISYANNSGVVHRDLKPSNVLVVRDEEGRSIPKIIDFGIATLADCTGLTDTGHSIGTPRFMAPEGLLGMAPREWSVSQDVYGLGTLLYFLMTGRGPYDDRSASHYDLVPLLRNRFVTPKPPRSAICKYDKELETLCLKCLAKAPQDRYMNAAEVADELSRYLTGTPIEAQPDRWRAKLYRSVNRHRISVGLVTISLCVAIAMTWLWSDSAIKSNQNHRMIEYLMAIQTSQVRVLESPMLLGNPASMPIYQDLLERYGQYHRSLVLQDIGQENAFVHAEHLLRISRLAHKVGLPDTAVQFSAYVDNVITSVSKPMTRHQRWNVLRARRLIHSARVKTDAGSWDIAILEAQQALQLLDNLMEDQEFDVLLDQADAYEALSQAEFLKHRRGTKLQQSLEYAKQELEIRNRLVLKDASDEHIIALARTLNDVGKRVYKSGSDNYEIVLQGEVLFGSRSILNAGILLVGSVQSADAVDALLTKASLQNSLGLICSQDLSSSDAQVLFSDNVKIFQQLAAQWPMVLEYQVKLAQAQGNLSDFWRLRKNNAQSIQSREKTCELYMDLLMRYGTQHDLAHDLGVQGVRYYYELAYKCNRQGDAMAFAKRLMDLVEDPSMSESNNLPQQYMCAVLFYDLIDDTDADVANLMRERCSQCLERVLAGPAEHKNRTADWLEPDFSLSELARRLTAELAAAKVIGNE